MQQRSQQEAPVEAGEALGTGQQNLFQMCFSTMTYISNSYVEMMHTHTTAEEHQRADYAKQLQEQTAAAAAEAKKDREMFVAQVDKILEAHKSTEIDMLAAVNSLRESEKAARDAETAALKKETASMLEMLRIINGKGGAAPAAPDSPSLFQSNSQPADERARRSSLGSSRRSRSRSRSPSKH